MRPKRNNNIADAMRENIYAKVILYLEHRARQLKTGWQVFVAAI